MFLELERLRRAPPSLFVHDLRGLITRSNRTERAVAHCLGVEAAAVSAWAELRPMPKKHLDQLGALLNVEWRITGDQVEGRPIVYLDVCLDGSCMAHGATVPRDHAHRLRPLFETAPAPTRRVPLAAGIDGMPMSLSSASYCSCGRRVR